MYTFVDDVQDNDDDDDYWTSDDVWRMALMIFNRGVGHSERKIFVEDVDPNRCCDQKNSVFATS